MNGPDGTPHARAPHPSIPNVLMLAYYFPPLGDTSCLRNISFARYLPEFGLTPIVLTVKNPDLSYCQLAVENEPLPQNLTVVRSRSLLTLNRFVSRLDSLVYRALRLLGVKWRRHTLYQLVIPDIFLGWIPMTLLAASRLVRALTIPVIFASVRPVSTAIIGALLKKLTGARLVIDYNNPWRAELILNYAKRFQDKHLYPLKIRRWIDALLEGWVLRNCDHVVVATEGNRDMYLWAYPFLEGKMSVIHIGFSDTFATFPDLGPFDKFTLLYTGNYYYHVDGSEAIFKAIHALHTRRILQGENFQFLFVGEYLPWLPQLIQKYGLEELVKIVGPVPRPAVRDYLAKAAMLFIRLFRPCLDLSTKAFEGLALGIPILAHMEDNEQARLIRKYSNESYIVDIDDDSGLEEALAAAFERWKAGRLERRPNPAYMERFNSRRLTGELAAILRGVLDDGIPRSEPSCAAPRPNPG